MASENSLVTDARPWLFKPGQTGNAGGRPKGLAQLVRQETKDGAELVAFMLRILRGRKQPLRYRLEAAAWLADRGFGKVALPLEHSGAEGGPVEVVFSYVNDWRGRAQRLAPAANPDADTPPD
jgi:hypothetical protein